MTEKNPGASCARGQSPVLIRHPEACRVPEGGPGGRSGLRCPRSPGTSGVGRLRKVGKGDTAVSKFKGLIDAANSRESIAPVPAPVAIRPNRRAGEGRAASAVIRTSTRSLPTFASTLTRAPRSPCCRKVGDESSASSSRICLPIGSRPAVDNPDTQISGAVALSGRRGMV